MFYRSFGVPGIGVRLVPDIGSCVIFGWCCIAVSTFVCLAESRVYSEEIPSFVETGFLRQFCLTILKSLFSQTHFPVVVFVLKDILEYCCVCSVFTAIFLNLFF